MMRKVYTGQRVRTEILVTKSYRRVSWEAWKIGDRAYLRCMSFDTIPSHSARSAAVAVADGVAGHRRRTSGQICCQIVQRQRAPTARTREQGVETSYRKIYAVLVLFTVRRWNLDRWTGECGTRSSLGVLLRDISAAQMFHVANM